MKKWFIILICVDHLYSPIVHHIILVITSRYIKVKVFWRIWFEPSTYPYVDFTLFLKNLHIVWNEPSSHMCGNSIMQFGRYLSYAKLTISYLKIKSFQIRNSDDTYLFTGYMHTKIRLSSLFNGRKTVFSIQSML